MTFSLDLNKLTKGEQILGGSAIALLILSFLPLWAKFEVPEIAGFGGSTRFSAWSAAFGFLLKLALILTIIAVIFVVLRAVGTSLNLPVPAWQIYAGTAGLTLLLLLITVLTGPVGDQGSFGGYEWSRGIAVFIAPLLGAGMAYGAYLHMQEEGGTSTTGGSTGGTTTPPPPAS